jgi:hypothetical protein
MTGDLEGLEEDVEMTYLNFCGLVMLHYHLLSCQILIDTLLQIVKAISQNQQERTEENQGKL